MMHSGDSVPRAGSDWVHGRAGKDTIYGYSGDDTLHGGAGADFIEGGWGVDILKGGGGKDTLVWSPTDTRIAGGRGVDRLIAENGGLDLRDVEKGMLTDIEIIDMREDNRSVTGADPRDKLTLTKADLLAISSTTDTLKVIGERGDSVDIVGRFKDLGVSGRFHQYKLGDGTLLVETDVIVR
jgi:Ca2+-binding RTX toxin-like protein